MKKAKENDILTDGKRTWKIVYWSGDKIALPLQKKSFELWADCEMEKIAIIPGLRIKR